MIVHLLRSRSTAIFTNATRQLSCVSGSTVGDSRRTSSKPVVGHRDVSSHLRTNHPLTGSFIGILHTNQKPLSRFSIRGLASSSNPLTAGTFTFVEPKNAVPVEETIIKSPGFEADLPSTASQEIDLTSFLGDVPPEVIDSTAEVIASGVITASDLNLTWWLPTGGMYNLLNTAHEFMPWWASIAALTLVARILLTPVVVSNQRNHAKMSEVMPELMKAQASYTKAMRIGNERDIITAMIELEDVRKRSSSSMMSTLKGPLFQAPVFISFFISLRAMANYPLESFKDGGLWWFKDLTLSDPYYILPLLTSVSLYAVIKTGVEFGNKTGATAGSELIQKIMLYGMPPFIFICTFYFPSAVLLYWCVNNFASLIQVYLMTRPKIREYLKIPAAKKWTDEELGKTGEKKGFVQGFKDTMDSMKVANEVVHRHRLQSAQNFERAGTGPIKKTYKLHQIPKKGDDL